MATKNCFCDRITDVNLLFHKFNLETFEETHKLHAENNYKYFLLHNIFESFFWDNVEENYFSKIDVRIGFSFWIIASFFASSSTRSSIALTASAGIAQGVPPINLPAIAVFLSNLYEIYKNYNSFFLLSYTLLSLTNFLHNPILNPFSYFYKVVSIVGTFLDALLFSYI